MKRLISLLLCVLVLTGCGNRSSWETVTDELPKSTAVRSENTYKILHGLPEEMELAYETELEKRFVHPRKGIEVSVQRFLADDLNSAVKYLSGRQSEQLQIVSTTQNGLPEYHFVWHAQTEEGGILTRADLVMDGMRCYALTYSVPELEAAVYENACAEVFAGFGLYVDEGV